MADLTITDMDNSTIIELASGIKLRLKLLTIRERFAAFRIIPAEDQGNPLRMGWIFSAMTVREIDGVPVPTAKSIDDIARLIEKLDDDGIVAAQQFIVDSQSKVAEVAKN